MSNYILLLTFLVIGNVVGMQQPASSSAPVGARIGLGRPTIPNTYRSLVVATKGTGAPCPVVSAQEKQNHSLRDYVDEIVCRFEKKNSFQEACWGFFEYLFKHDYFDIADELANRLPWWIRSRVLNDTTNFGSCNQRECFLILAARRAKYTQVCWLLKWQVNVCVQGFGGWTALHWAASKDDVLMIDALSKMIDFGTLKSTSTVDGVSPLYIAIARDKVAAVRRLLELGVTIDEAAKECAAKRGNQEIMRLLEQAGSSSGAAAASSSGH